MFVGNAINHSLTIKSSDFIKAICRPLQDKGVINFVHDITFSKGQLSELTTEPEVYKLWAKKELPAVFVDDNGRNLEPGIYIKETLEKRDPYYSIATSQLLQVTQSEKVIQIVEAEDECQNMYSFTLNFSGDNFLHWLLNNVENLKSFIQYYKIEATDLITQIKNPKNRITLPIIDNIENTENLVKLKSENFAFKIPHRVSKKPISLSKQQSTCFNFLIQGITAKEIANKMNLSVRTVEHYLENIRKILDCKSSKDLISYYSNVSRA